MGMQDTVDHEARDYHEEQDESDSKDAHPVAMKFRCALCDGFRRDGSTTGGTEAPAVNQLSAVATKRHFCYQGYAVSRVLARTEVPKAVSYIFPFPP
jgi:hypothetical protein